MAKNSLAPKPRNFLSLIDSHMPESAKRELATYVDPQLYAESIAEKLRDSVGVSAIDRNTGMHGLDAMAGGDLRANRAANKAEYRQKIQDMALNFNPAAVGQVVWHGSPHKFNKFDMSKIGTGEGAQAYGHGLYMAESPAVANEYRARLASNQGDFSPQFFYGDEPVSATPAMRQIAAYMDKSRAAEKAKEIAASMNPSLADEIAKLDPAKIRVENSSGVTYKVDIPDEAVARMLDWDKPLSEQAPEVQQGILKAGLVDPKHQFSNDELLAGEFIKNLRPEDQALLSSKGGIPGIRYLDGGSRGAGQGSSNFVLFDDQLPRILEVNGKPTGLKAWARGEWNK